MKQIFILYLTKKTVLPVTNCYHNIPPFFGKVAVYIKKFILIHGNELLPQCGVRSEMKLILVVVVGWRL